MPCCSTYPASAGTCTLSLHDALPISGGADGAPRERGQGASPGPGAEAGPAPSVAAVQAEGPEDGRSEEHTSELQSHSDLVCRLLLEKKKESYCHLRLISSDHRASSCA